MSNLKKIDPEVYQAILGETKREADNLELIASENFVSEAVLETMGSVMTNKYSEGYPGKRYYGGCEFMDVGGHLTHGHPVNFSGKFFNVVPYGVNKETEVLDYDELKRTAKQAMPKMIIAGASAYPRELDFTKFKQIADEVGAYLMVDIAHIAGLIVAGIHQSPVPCADFVTTTTHKTLRGPRGGMIMCKKKYARELDREIMPGIQGGPLMHIIAAKAVAFKEAQKPEFKDYQNQIVKNAKTLASELVNLGYHVVSGGTDTHLLLVSFIQRNLTGKVVEEALEKAGVTVNKNTVPFDPQKPFITSGIRIGTPAVTTRGMKEEQMKKIASWIDQVISNLGDEKTYQKVKEEVKELCNKFPLYRERMESG